MSCQNCLKMNFWKPTSLLILSPFLNPQSEGNDLYLNSSQEDWDIIGKNFQVPNILDFQFPLIFLLYSQLLLVKVSSSSFSISFYSFCCSIRDCSTTILWKAKEITIMKTKTPKSSTSSNKRKQNGGKKKTYAK